MVLSRGAVWGDGCGWCYPRRDGAVQAGGVVLSRGCGAVRGEGGGAVHN